MAGIMDMVGMMKKAQDLQEKMQQIHEETAQLQIEGVSGAGLVTVTMGGKGDVRGVSIDPTLLKPDDVEILEDLLVAAFNDARARAEAAVAERMADVTKDLALPEGFKLPF